MELRNVVIVDACRTAVGKFGGTLKPVKAHELATVVIKGILERNNLDPAKVSEVIMGQCRQSSDESNVARVAALEAGIPDTVPAYKGADSLVLTRHVALLLREKGYKVVNVDSTVIAQRPKLAPHIGLMRERIAETLEISLDDVNVKATTEEKLGFTGRKEGISAHAVCLIMEKA